VSYPFDSAEGLIVVAARLHGPKGEIVVRLALDTGATGSLVSTDLLVSLGYDPAESSAQIRITTGSGVESATETGLDRIDALGMTVRGFPIVSHTLPEAAGVDGLLGLDFFRGRRLILDFRSGTVAVE